jgi:hypothetical protein
MRAAVACASVLLLAGCASWPRDAARLSEELVRLAGVALATASTGEDVRAVLRQDLRTGPRNRVVYIAGHRFVLAPATLDVAPPGSGPYRWLLAQSIELAEQTCLPFQGGAGVLAAVAEQVQRVTVGIELQEGCIVALHVEQASAVPRE